MIWPSHASSFGSCCLNGVTFKTHNSQGAWDISCEVSLQSEQKQVRRSRCTAVSSSTLTCHVWLPKGMAKNTPFNEQREVAPERMAYIMRTRVPHQRMWDKSKATKTAETVLIYLILWFRGLRNHTARHLGPSDNLEQFQQTHSHFSFLCPQLWTMTGSIVSFLVQFSCSSSCTPKISHSPPNKRHLSRSQRHIIFSTIW